MWGKPLSVNFRVSDVRTIQQQCGANRILSVNVRGSDIRTILQQCGVNRILSVNFRVSDVRTILQQCGVNRILSVNFHISDVRTILQCPTISRLLKGAFHLWPPLPRYTSTWNVQVVLQYLEGLGPSDALTLKTLTLKLTMLMCLTRPSCSADLASFQLDRCQFKPEGVVFLPSALTKQSSQGGVVREFFFSSFPQNSTLCPVETLCHYEQATAPLRPKDTSQLLVAIVKPHKPVASCTIARWLCETLKLAGIDASIFAGHSTRGASTSAAAGAGLTTIDIMNAADWSTGSVFRRHYYRPSHDVSFGRAVLSTSYFGET